MGKKGIEKIGDQKISAVPYPWAEEITNSISHGIGLVFGIVGLVLLLVQAVDTGEDVTAITSYSLYGGSMILLFLSSTLYHAIPHQKVKHWLKKFHHCAIYLLIAGTYTPFLLDRFELAAGQWADGGNLGASFAGRIVQTGLCPSLEVLSLVTDLAMGWLSLIVIYQLAIHLALGGVTLLAVFGAVYTRGVIFYASKRIRFGRAIWHGFVLCGSVCHFMAIYLYV
ncbi:MAG: hemolysin III family protein [Serratia symbiotica]|nr:hemolysin III family protein [Serratia symbiotica]